MASSDSVEHELELQRTLPSPTQTKVIEQNTNNPSNEACIVHWAKITKTVKIVSENKGLKKSTIGKSPGASPIGDKSISNSKVILKNVSGSAFPGELLALMGPSGSGKTSLLDALSGRSAYESGMLNVNGVEVKGAMMKKFKRKVAYVKQRDLFFDHLSVREQLTYTALLRLPSNISRSDKYEEVTRIIRMLRLQNCADTPIRLVSGGEKKRVNIGTELLTDPKVIILDEPTSGLDSTSAVALLKTLHTLAKENGKTIITSIHQPSSAMFRAFDKLMLLAEGHVVFYGSPSTSLKYLREKGFACPDGYNAADHWMDLLVVDSAIHSEDETIGLVDDADLDKSTDEKKDIESVLPLLSKSRQFLIQSWDDELHAAEIITIMENESRTLSKNNFLIEDRRKYNNSWGTQFRVLMHRCMRNSRSAVFTPLNLVKSVLIGILIGFVYFQLPYSEKYVRDRDGYFFFTMAYWVFESMFASLFSFPLERDIIFKERASGSYHLSAYFLAKTVSEAPTRVILPILYMIITFFLAAIKNDFIIFLGATLCSLMAVMTGESYGLLVGAAVMDFEKAQVIMTIVALMFMVLGGFFVENAPKVLDVFKYLSPFKYSFDASRQMVFYTNVPCDGSNALLVCMEDGVEFATPEQLKEALRIQGSISFNVAMLFVLFIVPRYLTYIVLSRKKAGERS